MFTAGKDENISNLKHSARNASEAVGDAAEKTTEELVLAANNAGRKVRKLVNNAGDEIVHAKEVVTSQIRTNPVQSSLVALGVGFVLGALFRR